MPLHLVKLCVGIDRIVQLARLQERRLQTLVADGQPPLLSHITRMMPKRADELLAGGSIYWVIRGQIQVRQRLCAIERFTDADGIGRCALTFDPTLVRTVAQPRRPFQGWRYLKPEDAPADLDEAMPGDDLDMPAEMRAELAALGLL